MDNFKFLQNKHYSTFLGPVGRQIISVCEVMFILFCPWEFRQLTRVLINYSTMLGTVTVVGIGGAGQPL